MNPNEFRRSLRSLRNFLDGPPQFGLSDPCARDLSHRPEPDFVSEEKGVLFYETKIDLSKDPEVPKPKVDQD